MKKALIILCLFAGIFLMSFDQIQQNNTAPFYEKQVNEVLLDTLEAGTLFKVYDQNKHVLYYKQNVWTPVCRTNECLPAELLMYWDAAGNFLGYKLHPQKPLTKVEHEEFSKNDYFRLYLLLNNPESELGNMQYKDLSRAKKNVETDAISGATQLNNNDNYVPGAIYTCFTLWHLTHSKELSAIFKENGKGRMQNTSISSKLLKEKIKSISAMDGGSLALFLDQLDKQKKLRKFGFQKLLTQEINELTPFHALLINNYITRQVFVFPEIEARLKQCKSTDEVFSKMLSDLP